MMGVPQAVTDTWREFDNVTNNCCIPVFPDVRKFLCTEKEDIFDIQKSS